MDFTGRMGDEEHRENDHARRHFHLDFCGRSLIGAEFEEMLFGRMRETVNLSSLNDTLIPLDILLIYFTNSSDF